MSSGESEAKAQAGEQQAESVSLLDQAIDLTTPQPEQDRLKELLSALAAESLKGTMVYKKGVSQTIKQAVDAIDGMVSKQLAKIMHHPEFQKLEGSWRGLNYLVKNSETGPSLKLKVLNCRKRELLQDLTKAADFDQSKIWRKLYEDEFGMPGGQPYGALIGDYAFTNHPDDMEILGGMSKVAAAAFCPFVSSADPALFNFKKWTDIYKPMDLATDFDSIEYTKWKSFRKTPDSRFVALTMPRTLARLPYGENTKPIDEFGFEEVPLGKGKKSISVSHDEYCWMNSAYVYGTKLTDAFAKHGMCVAVRGVAGGGKVEGLPAHIFEAEDGDMDLKCPTEVNITDRRTKELSDLGFMPLSHFKNTDYAAFIHGQTTQRPEKYRGPNADAANANAEIMARLPYIMATSRFAHYLKIIARDAIGSFMERDECEDFLNEWIMDYVCVSKKPSQKEKARLPLAEAKVQVKEVKGKPGSYQAVAWLRPWIQLEELTTSFRMVARIPKLPS